MNGVNHVKIKTCLDWEIHMIVLDYFIIFTAE